MKIDIISIFPQYLDPLGLSLIGKAQEARLLSIAIHDLRDYSEGKHRTVDDSPYGGGAGMVMKVEPWMLALKHVVGVGRFPRRGQENSCDVSRTGRTTLVIPSPVGQLFTQATAQELAKREHVVFACGRYEGIDERVQELAGEMCDVLLLSVGDYVLNGGEVAALVMVEAIARLIPGVMGNRHSLDEESHNAEGLLEYPVYTKPAEYQGAAVPEVLLSGNHQEISLWRFKQRLIRTKRYRPELFENVDVETLSSRQCTIYNEVKGD